MCWFNVISTKQAETPYFHCGPSEVRTKMREKSKLGKQKKKQKQTNLRMNKSKENTLKHMYKVIITSRIEIILKCTSKYKYTHNTQSMYLYFKNS